MSRVFDASQITPNDTFLQTPASVVYNDLQEITIAAWVYHTADDPNGYVCVRDPLQNFNPQVFIGNSSHGPSQHITAEVVAGSDPSAVRAVSTGDQVIPFNQWVHVAVTFSFSGDQLVHIYIDGTEIAYFEHSTNPSGQQLVTFEGYYIGGPGHELLNDNFTGRIAEFAIFNRALTAPEIAALSASSIGAAGIADVNLVGYWHLCGTSSPEPDVSGNGNDAVLSSPNPPIQGPDSPGFSCVALLSDEVWELQGLKLRAHGLTDSFSFATFNMGGSPGMADTHFEVQGYRIKIHDNGDGTFSPITTPSTGVGDVAVEIQGLRFKLHPTGETVSIGGALSPLYAIVVFAV